MAMTKDIGADKSTYDNEAALVASSSNLIKATAATFPRHAAR